VQGSPVKKEAASRCALLNRGALFGLLLFAAVACLTVTGTLLAVFRPDTSPNVLRRTVTFADRVTYQRAIEDV